MARPISLKPASLKRAAIGIPVAIALVYLAACGLLYALQGVVLYHPSPLRLEPDAQLVAIHAPTGLLHGWIVNPGKPSALVYFGGNGESLEYDVDRFAGLFANRTVYLFPYRGYGPNAGKPDEHGIEADALAEFDFARAHHAQVAVVGRSLGSGVATWVAAHRPVERLVLVTPYDSILNIARGRYGLFPVAWLLRDRYESWRNADKIRVPTLVLLASDDQAIPRANSDALIAHLHPRPAVVVIEHSDHNNLSNSPAYADAIRNFLGQPPPSSPPAPPR